nr:helix-turn-helix domain-containing protein [Thermoanaerobaculia bacterium]
MANQRGKNKPRPWQANGEEEVSFGTWLRRQREVREIGLREIADASKISLRYLEAFEQDRFDVLPAVVFARGFLREYAKYVGLDADEAVNRFLAAYRDSESGEEVEPQRPERAGSNQWLYNLLMFVAVAAVLVLIAVVAFKAERRRKETGEPVAAAALPPAP